MSSLAEQLSASRGLLKSLDAITNCRAFLAVLGTMVLGIVTAVLIGLLAAQMGGTAAAIVGLLGFLIVAVIFVAGFSAAGFIVNDQIRERELRTVGDAIMAALLTLPRLLGVGLLIGVIGLLLGVTIALALLLCKIPFIGPVLYVLVFPLSVLVIGACWYAGFFVVALSAPSIWEGNSIMGTLGILWVVIRKRLLAVVIYSILLVLLVGLVAALVMSGLMIGMAVTGGLSAVILQIGSTGSMVGGLSARALGAMGGNGYLIAGAVGGAVIMACAMVIPALVAIAGNCIIFANVSDNLSAEDYEARLAGAVDSVRQKANAARQNLEAQRQKSQAVPEEPASVVPACPQCKGVIAVNDVFCGHCGHKLK